MRHDRRGEPAAGQCDGFSKHEMSLWDNRMIAPNAREVNLDLSRLIAQAGRLASFHEARARRHRAIERALLALVERGQP